MKRTTTILIAICVSALFANGKQISQNAALSAARKYSRTGQVAPAKNLRSDKTNNAPYYAFNLEQGYVIVSGDDEMTELVGYAENGFFDAENVPPQMQLWLDGYAEYVAAVQSGKAKARKILLSDSPSVVVEPLVTTKWNQDAPFNNFAPEYTDDNNNTQRCATGCAATAMAQIMKFHNWPEQGVGHYSYEHQSFGTISSNFSEHVYDWTNMIDRYNNGEYSSEQADAVALLMKDCGVSLNMNYGPVSGASIYSYYPAFKNYFRYTSRTVNRSGCETAEFTKIITDELQEGRPIIYCGTGEDGGHAFVVDGYDTNYFLHVNWGWGGYSDGYFDMNYMDPTGLGIGGGSGAFKWNQGIVLARPLKDGVEPYEFIQQLCFVPYDDVKGGIFCEQEMPANRGDDVTILLRNTANLSGESFFGSLNVGVFDDSGALVTMGNEERIENNNGELLEFQSGSLYSVDLPMTLNTAGIADGNYIVRAMSKANGDVWRKFASTDCLNMTVADGKVYLSAPTPNISMVGIGSYDTATYKGFSFNADVTVHNSSSIPVDGSIMFTVTDSETGDALSGSLRAIVYDNCDFKARISFPTTYDFFVIGKTYNISFTGFQTTDGKTLPINNAIPLSFSIVENAEVQNSLTFFNIDGSPFGMTVSNENFSKTDDTMVCINCIGNANKETYMGYIGIETYNLHTGSKWYSAIFKTVDIPQGAYYAQLNAPFKALPIATAAGDGVYRLSTVSREIRKEYLFPDWLYTTNSSHIDFRVNGSDVTVLHPVDEVAFSAAPESYPTIGTNCTFNLDLENKNDKSETISAGMYFVDQDNNGIGLAQVDGIILKAYEQQTVPVTVFIDPAKFHERSHYAAYPVIRKGESYILGEPYEFNGAISGINDVNAVNVKAYPNPAVDVLHVNVEALRIDVYNAGGALVADASNADSVNVAHLPAGYYIAVVATADGTARIPFVKK
uniref:thiol protease/hemagglutinin PrtT n=1 Tax=Candidatus Limisoma sp. TaxID=3076476 RepID=UPI003FEFA498